MGGRLLFYLFIFEYTADHIRKSRLHMQKHKLLKPLSCRMWLVVRLMCINLTFCMLEIFPYFWYFHEKKMVWISAKVLYTKEVTYFWISFFIIHAFHIIYQYFCPFLCVHLSHTHMYMQMHIHIFVHIHTNKTTYTKLCFSYPRLSLTPCSIPHPCPWSSLYFENISSEWKN